MGDLGTGDSGSDSESDCAGVLLPTPRAGFEQKGILTSCTSPSFPIPVWPNGVSISGFTPQPRANPARAW